VLIVPFESGTVIVRVVLPEIPEHSNATFLEASELSFTLKTSSANSGLLMYPAPLVIALLFSEIFAEPSKATPAIFRGVVNVAADPVVFWFKVATLAAASVPEVILEAFDEKALIDCCDATLVAESLDISSSSKKAVPLNPVFNTGLVNVLLVKVCDPVRVATVESIAKVAVLPVEVDAIPVPPASVKVSESRSIAIELPSSVVISKSSAVI